MTRPEEVSNTALAQLISAQGQGMGEIKAIVTQLSAHLHRIELDKTEAHALLSGRIDGAYSKIDQQAEKIKTIEASLNKISEAMPAVLTAYRIMAFVGSALGISVMALLWALITGQVTLVGAVP